MGVQNENHYLGLHLHWVCSAGKVKQATKPAAGKGVFRDDKKKSHIFPKAYSYSFCQDVAEAGEPVGHMSLPGGDGSSATVHLFGAQTSASMGNVGAK